MAPNDALTAHMLQEGLTSLFVFPHSYRWLLSISKAAAGVWTEHSNKASHTHSQMASIQVMRKQRSSNSETSQAAQPSGYVAANRLLVPGL